MMVTRAGIIAVAAFLTISSAGAAHSVENMTFEQAKGEVANGNIAHVRSFAEAVRQGWVTALIGLHANMLVPSDYTKADSDRDPFILQYQCLKGVKLTDLLSKALSSHQPNTDPFSLILSFSAQTFCPNPTGYSISYQPIPVNVEPQKVTPGISFWAIVTVQFDGANHAFQHAELDDYGEPRAQCENYIRNREADDAKLIAVQAQNGYPIPLFRKSYQCVNIKGDAEPDVMNYRVGAYFDVWVPLILRFDGATHAFIDATVADRASTKERCESEIQTRRQANAARGALRESSGGDSYSYTCKNVHADVSSDNMSVR